MNVRQPFMPLLLALAALSVSCAASEKPPEAIPHRVTEGRPVPRAQLRGLKGGVTIKRAAGDDWLPAREGMPLFENDKVRTVTGARAQIVFSNGSMVSLGENALIGIAETRTRPGQERTDLTVLRGRVDAELESPARQALSVTTPAATVRAGREIVFQ